MLSTGTAVHLAQDWLANTVALLWPLRRREYGLGLDRLGGVDDHAEIRSCYATADFRISACSSSGGVP